MTRDALPYVFGVAALGVFGTVFLVLLVLSAIHDAEHCTHWETYETTHCDTIGTRSSSHTTCYPVEGRRCTAWDDVGSTP